MRRLGMVLGLTLGLQVAPLAAQEHSLAVYFDSGADTLDETARSVLDQAADRYRNTGYAGIVLAGHTDRAGSAVENMGLSQRRTNAVRAYLARPFGGVPDGSVVTEAFGETRPAVDTADGVREPRNNRVEIVFSQGSGW